MKRIAVAVAAALAAGMSPGATAQDSEVITIGTGGPIGVYFVVGDTVCRMVHKEAAGSQWDGLRCTASSTAGSIYNIGEVCRHQFDFGVVQSDWQFHAYNGSKPYRVNYCPQLRTVFGIHAEPYQIIAAKDSGIHSWADLEGKRFNIGNPGSGQRSTTEELMAGHGWSADRFAVASELSSTAQPYALCEGRIDAYGFSASVPNTSVAVATDNCDAYVVDLGSDDVAAKLVDDNVFYAWTTIPEGTYKTSEAEVKTFGVRATFVTSADVPEDVVYEVTRAVFENLEDFRSAHPALASLTADSMVNGEGLSAPFHAGAVKYFKERGWR